MRLIFHSEFIFKGIQLKIVLKTKCRDIVHALRFSLSNARIKKNIMRRDIMVDIIYQATLSIYYLNIKEHNECNNYLLTDIQSNTLV